MRGALESDARGGTLCKRPLPKNFVPKLRLKSSQTCLNLVQILSHWVRAFRRIRILFCTRGALNRPRSLCGRRPKNEPKNDPETDPRSEPKRAPKWTPRRPRSRPKSVPNRAPIHDPKLDPQKGSFGSRNGPIWDPFLTLFHFRRGPPPRNGDFQKIW